MKYHDVYSKMNLVYLSLWPGLSLLSNIARSAQCFAYCLGSEPSSQNKIKVSSEILKTKFSTKFSSISLKFSFQHCSKFEGFQFVNPSVVEDDSGGWQIEILRQYFSKQCLSPLKGTRQVTTS